MAPFIGPAWAPDGQPLLVESLHKRGYTRYRHMQRTRVVMDDYGNAVIYERRCSTCQRWLPLTFEHYATRADGVHQGMQARCNICSAVMKTLERRRDPETVRNRNRTGHARRMQDPEYRAAFNARTRKNVLRQWERDPERMRELAREQQRRYYARLRKDPVRRLQKLEQARIARRLRKEREGRPLNERTRHEHERDHEFYRSRGMGTGKLPARALHDALEALIAKRGDIEAREAVCAQAGIAPRTLWAWGPNSGQPEVQFAVADRVLTGLGLLWWEVWTDGDDYERARRAWEGNEDVAA